MDRLSKAFELAGRHRRESEQRITYSHTQIVSVDREVLRQKRIVTGIIDPVAMDAYKLLRTRVLHRMLQNRWVTLGITSPGPGVGKTLTSINLAISLAMKQNYTVVLVDADLRRPSVHQYLGIEPEFGLRDYLIDGKPVEEILLHPKIDRLVVLPGRDVAENPSELLASPRMITLVQELKTRYPSRLVLFDLPPVLVGDDVVAFAPNLDTAMLVVEDGGTQADEFARTVSLLEGVDLIGTVLNKSDEGRRATHYDYYD